MNKKLIIQLIIAVSFIIVGIGFLCFPSISNYLYKKNVEKDREEFIISIQKAENEYENETKSNSENVNKNVTDMMLNLLYRKLQEENENLYETKQQDLTDPFSYEQITIDLSEYGLKNNIIGYIKIPKVNIELPIILGANTENMLKGSVHLTQTSYPIGGNSTNCVIAAHRGYGKAKMFRNIEKIAYKDKIYINNFREELVYEVYSIKIIEPDDIRELKIEEDKDIITLITCHPYRVNSQRYIVKANRIYE